MLQPFSYVFDDPANLAGSTCIFHPPVHYRLLIDAVRSQFSLDPHMVAKYVSHSRQNTLPQLMNDVGLTKFSSILDTSHNKELSVIQVDTINRSHLHQLGNLMFMEEIQMHMDIAEYDLHHVLINFKEKKPEDAIMGRERDMMSEEAKRQIELFPAQAREIQLEDAKKQKYKLKKSNDNGVGQSILIGV